MESWLGLFAGDISPIEPILNRVLKQLENAPNDFSVIVNTFVSSYQAERLERVSQQVTGKYGLTYEAFLKHGKKLIQQGQYEQNVDRN